MPKYIDADELMKKMQERHDRIGAGQDDKYETLVVMAAINAEPAANVQTVIRCGECVHGKSERYKLVHCAATGRTCPDTFFCAAGMRSE